MRHNPFFSTLTASLNNASSIEQTLESIKNQTFQVYEHIVIDGGSNDGTIDILNRMEHSYNMSWLSEPDQGIADALNKGLKKAKGQYIVVIQADDSLLAPDILEKVYSLLNKQRIDILSFPVILQHPDRGKVLRKPIRFLWWNHFKFIIPHQGCFVKRSVFDEIGGFNTSFKIAMDYDFFYRALKHNSSVQFGELPVTLMGGTGIGTVTETAPDRLWEEQKVHALNEDNKFWRTAQKTFWRLYLPYKKWHLKKSYNVFCRKA